MMVVDDDEGDDDDDKDFPEKIRQEYNRNRASWPETEEDSLHLPLCLDFFQGSCKTVLPISFFPADMIWDQKRHQNDIPFSPNFPKRHHFRHTQNSINSTISTSKSRGIMFYSHFY